MATPNLVQLNTKDGLTLPGLFFKVNNSKKAIIRLHGNGNSSIFYADDPQDEIAAVFNKNGFSYLPFNNRGANYVRRLTVKNEQGNKNRKLYGMAYELIRECVFDIEAAVEFLKSNAYSEIYLLGHSSGANKICVYNHYKSDNDIKGYILAAGSDDTGRYYEKLGDKRFWEMLKLSEVKIKSGDGEEMINEFLPEYFFSYKSFFDIANPDGDYNTFPFIENIRSVALSKKNKFNYFNEISKATLVIYGEADLYQYGNVTKIVEILENYQPTFEYKVIREADHGFNQHQIEFAETIVEWLLQKKI